MFSALLDTCVLVPSRARDVLLEVASRGAFRPLWSSEILAELDRTLRRLLGNRGCSPEDADAYLARLFRQMETAFPDALVISAVRAVAGRTGRSGPKMTARDVAGYLQAHGTPAFGERLLAELS